MSNETKLYQCRCYLFCMYELLDKNSNQIAKECRVGATTILRWLRKFNIRIKTNIEIRIGEKNGMYGIRRYGEKAPFYGKHHSDKYKNQLSDKMKGRKGGMTPSWKGDDIKNLSYNSIHRRVRTNKPLSVDGKCRICYKVVDKKGIIKLELSNITEDHRLSLNPDDYQDVHHSCHLSYDAKRRKERKSKKLKKSKENKYLGQVNYWLN